MKNRKKFIWVSLILFTAAVLGGSGLRVMARPVAGIPVISPKTHSAIAIQSSTASVAFPASLTFKISVSDDVNIVDIRLRYTLQRDTFANAFSESFVDFIPGVNVQASWVMDMQKTGGLPPGTVVNYWWVVTDSTGRNFESSRQQIEFADDRFKWKNLQQNNVTLYWYSGSDTFANTLMTTAQQALVRLGNNTGAKLSRPIRIFIYASTQDLQGSMIFPAEWTGGVSFTEYAIIAIGISPSNLAWGQNAIAHELTHLAVHQMTFNPYNELPTWLDEGLAVFNELQPDPSYVILVSRAFASNTLASVRSLSSPFSAYSNEASLSYAESYSVVNYLIGTYGQQKMLSLLNTFEQGSGYDDAFKKVYGFDMDQLYTLWTQNISGR
jgi:hypothetical protein